MNITLIGMPGSGKSFVGRELAAKLNLQFVEIDTLLEEEHGAPLQEIVEHLGREAFLDAEAEMILVATKDRDGLVISPGGSAIYREQAMQYLKRISKVVYLQTSLTVLEKRIGDAPRGIVIAPGKTFTDLFAERAPLYAQYADYVVNGDGAVADVVTEIAALV